MNAVPQRPYCIGPPGVGVMGGCEPLDVSVGMESKSSVRTLPTLNC